MNFKSYVSKVFVVESSKAIIRDEQLKEQRYQAGDELPPGKHIGDVKTIPQRTEIKVTDVKTDSGRHTFVLAAAAIGNLVYGWTAAMNLESGFKNETAGLAPSKWDLEPVGSNMTCIDANRAASIFISLTSGSTTRGRTPAGVAVRILVQS